MIRFQISLALISLLLAGRAYGDKSECVTRCGLKAPNFDCVGLRDIETSMLYALSVFVPEWSYDDMCVGLADWRLFVHVRNAEDRKTCARGGFVVGHSKNCFVGYTHVFTHEIEVESPEWSSGVVAHELIHAMQVNFGDMIGHCNWGPRGILRALKLHGGPILFKEGTCSPISELVNYR